jgi:parvulin-like peptidyl-prolyl isomerase
MRRFFQLVTLFACFTAMASAGEVLDRVVAIVNSTPIFQSDWELALRCEALLDRRSPETLSPAEQREVFDRLVDQELLHEQMRGYMITTVTDDEVNARLKEIREQIEGGKTDAQWHDLLKKADVSEEELKSRIRTQLEVLRFLDSRFRPTVRVDFRTIQLYYREQFLPELHKQGGQDIPLSEVAPKIREILTQQRISEQVAAWLQTLREQADIRIPSAPKPEAQVVEKK